MPAAGHLRTGVSQLPRFNLDSTDQQPSQLRDVGRRPRPVRYDSQDEGALHGSDYPDPWVPRTFSTWIVKASTFQRTSDRTTGQVATGGSTAGT